MSADLFRFILLLLGMGLIAGIYLWDHHKRTESRARVMRELKGRHDDPVLDGAEQESLYTDAEPTSASPVGPVSSRQGSKRSWWLNISRLWRRRSAREAAMSDAADEPAQQPGSAAPQLILQINVKAQNGYFEGPDLLRAADEAGLEPGEMDIFHRFEAIRGRRRMMFSMANMVNPGVFPFDDMGSFTTPGVTLFARLPGPKDGLIAFQDMLDSAEILAELLRGELQDETHSALTKQTIEHIRGQIREHGRRVQLMVKK